MKASTKAKLVSTGQTALIIPGVMLLILICLVGACAALMGWVALDDWCARQVEVKHD